MRLSRVPSLVFFVALAVWATQASAHPAYYANYCSECHGETPTTCNGCHSHGSHSDAFRTDINVAGATDQPVYQAGDTVTVTVTGGYRTGWLRAVLYDENFTELARASGEYPLVVMVPAPADAGDYNWSVSEYDNYQYETPDASFGLGISDLLQVDYFTPDPNNPNHGFQTVAIPTFTVAP